MTSQRSRFSSGGFLNGKSYACSSRAPMRRRRVPQSQACNSARPKTRQIRKIYVVRGLAWSSWLPHSSRLASF
jgi:hypothetical protein